MKHTLFLLATVLFGLFSATYGNLGPLDCTGTVNSIPFIDEAPTHVRSVANGDLYQINSIQPPLLVAHVYGSPKERGIAQGMLMKEEIEDVFDGFTDWVVEQAAGDLWHAIPEFVRDFIVKFGVDAALDLQYELMHDYISQDWKDEMEGMAEGAGLHYMDVARFAVFPELVEAACSMVGAWGEATKNTSMPGSLYQLRALDWATSSPLQKWPLVLVSHPTVGNPFATLGWPGFTGALTGMSTQVGICEKVWLHYNGTDHREGTPFTFVLRDILQYDNTTQQGIERLRDAKRTCSIFTGVGSINSPEEPFRIMHYSVDQFQVFNDVNWVWPAHPSIKDVVYVDKHTQPSNHNCLAGVLQQHYGSLDASAIIRNAAAQLGTGDTHAAVYDYGHMQMYVSNAGPYVNGTAVPAYARPWIKLNMATEFTRNHSEN